MTAGVILIAAALAQDIHMQVSREFSESGARQFTLQMAEHASQTKLVAGAPYSAEERSVITQTLADGNRIVNTTSAKLFRDQQGRTRVERLFKQFLPATGESQSQVSIYDPVASRRYMLDERSRTVTKNVTKQALDTQLILLELAHKPVEKGQVEDLGKQMMEGVAVQGTRITTTIPPGQIGNERPIDIVSERWYSPDLQMVIMSKRTDPRMGETVYTISNINRTNPDITLFQVPSGYTDALNNQLENLRRAITHPE